MNTAFLTTASVVIIVASSAFATSPCTSDLKSPDELRLELESKIDPDAKAKAQVSWGKYESEKVAAFKKSFGGDDQYSKLFLPEKFDLFKMDAFATTTRGSGQDEAIRFFGEMLRLMSKDQIKEFNRTLLDLANQISFGAGLLGLAEGEIITDQRKFDWKIVGPDVSVRITDYKKPNLGWM